MADLAWLPLSEEGSHQPTPVAQLFGTAHLRAPAMGLPAGTGSPASGRRYSSIVAAAAPTSDPERACSVAHSSAWSATASQPGAPHVQWGRPSKS